MGKPEAPLTSAALRPLARFEPWSVYATGALPGIGGVIRQRDEDFLVEEIPLYEPCGEGEHIYLLVEKKGMATSDAARMLGHHFGVPSRGIGYAGMKDKHAITRQVFSIHTPGKKPEDFPQIRHDRLNVLWTDLHTNKLRLGHLRGNRFSIRVRAVSPTSVLHASRVLNELRRVGVPNFAGEQRFGYRGNNHILGQLLLQNNEQGLLDELLGPDAALPELNPEMRACYAAGDFEGALQHCPRASRAEREALRTLAKGKTAHRAIKFIDEITRRFWLSAFQSAIFNRVLERRLVGGTLATLAPGDLAMKHENGAVFAVDDAVAADPGTAERLKNLEISPSGPLWGAKMMRASGSAGAMEDAELAGAGVSDADLARAAESSIGLPGARRALRVPLIDPEVEGGVDEHGSYVRCAFELPPGAFATVVMREVMKTGGEEPPTSDAADGESSPE